MDFFIRDDNVRPGNRGGRDQFKWDDIRMMNNKERESYLGVSQSIGFLDKGGKWRKRDWWQSFNPELMKEKDVVDEKMRIQMEENQMLKDAIYGKSKKEDDEAKNNKKLTDFQWEKMMKKESKFNPNDSQLYDFYEDDKHRAGLGMKSTVSFRTNPYDKNMSLSKLEGNQCDNKTIKDGSKDDGASDIKEKGKESSTLKKYIHDYVHIHRKKNRTRSHSKLSKEKKNKHKDKGKGKDKDKEDKHKHHYRHHHHHHHRHHDTNDSKDTSKHH